jgi:hypothetical protein
MPVARVRLDDTALSLRTLAVALGGIAEVVPMKPQMQSAESPCPFCEQPWPDGSERAAIRSQARAELLLELADELSDDALDTTVPRIAVERQLRASDYRQRAAKESNG